MFIKKLFLFKDEERLSSSGDFVPLKLKKSLNQSFTNFTQWANAYIWMVIEIRQFVERGSSSQTSHFGIW